MKLNFKRFEIFTGMDMKQCVVQDVRETVADLIYQNGYGVRSLDLSLRVLNAQGEEEYAGEDIELIRSLTEKFCSPFFIVSFRHAVDNNQSGDNPC